MLYAVKTQFWIKLLYFHPPRQGHCWISFLVQDVLIIFGLRSTKASLRGHKFLCGVNLRLLTVTLIFLVIFSEPPLASKTR